MTDAFSSLKEALFSFTSDSFVILGVFLLLLFYGFRLGRDRLVVLSLAFFIGSVLYQLFPYIREFTLFSSSTMAIALSQGLVWLALVIGSHFALSGLPERDYVRRGIVGAASTVFCAAATTTYLLVVAHQILSLSALYAFGGSIAALFAGTEALFWTSAALLLSVLAASRV